MGFFKKDYCMVFVGNLRGYPHTVSIKELDEYRFQAEPCIRTSFGNIPFIVHVFDAYDYMLETLQDIASYGLLTTGSTKQEVLEDKQELIESLKSYLILLHNLELRHIKKCDVCFDFRRGEFMLLCKTRF